MEPRVGKWVYAIPVLGDVDPLCIIEPYLRLVEDVPMSLWAFDELEIHRALHKVSSRITQNKNLTETEKSLREFILNALEGAGLCLNDYVLSLALEPNLIVILTP